MSKINTDIGTIARANAVLERFIEECSVLKVPAAYKVALLSRDLSLLIETAGALLEKFDGDEERVTEIMSSEVEIENYDLTADEVFVNNDGDATVQDVKALMEILKPT